MTSIAPTERRSGDDIIDEAELLRLRAKEMAEAFPSPYTDLIGQPSAWCVVTQKSWWSRIYHTMEDKDHLREVIERGHKVVLMIGLVAYPYTPLSATNHAAVVSYGEPRKHSPEMLARIVLRAKRYALSALFK